MELCSFDSGMPVHFPPSCFSPPIEAGDPSFPGLTNSFLNRNRTSRGSFSKGESFSHLPVSFSLLTQRLALPSTTSHAPVPPLLLQAGWFQVWSFPGTFWETSIFFTPPCFFCLSSFPRLPSPTSAPHLEPPFPIAVFLSSVLFFGSEFREAFCLGPDNFGRR